MLKDLQQIKFKFLYVILPLIFLTGVSVFVEGTVAQTASVPDWVKTTAGWWAEGKISEQEYLNSIEFFTSDVSGEFMAVIRGISQEGELVQTTCEFTVE